VKWDGVQGSRAAQPAAERGIVASFNSEKTSQVIQPVTQRCQFHHGTHTCDTSPSLQRVALLGPGLVVLGSRCGDSGSAHPWLGSMFLEVFSTFAASGIRGFWRDIRIPPFGAGCRWVPSTQCPSPDPWLLPMPWSQGGGWLHAWLSLCQGTVPSPGAFWNARGVPRE